MATRDVKLLGTWSCPYVNRVQLALKLKSIEYEFIEDNPYNRSEILVKNNPVLKKIPVLIHGNKPVCESLIIVQYIDDAWPIGPSLLPSDAYDRKDYFGGENIGYIDIVLGSSLAWLRVTEIVVGVQLLDQTRTPGLAKWAERVISNDVFKDVLPETKKLLELHEKIQAFIKSST
ncbi:hypothetical protein RD792_006619 [Penstemon davidsonii]|uniref:glutathione transferase n=1 Tax=Penstemon davidsonii TaxID=160366 RepID=A0ABR0DD73_9LAMI|nr:hypothetical protein RD792_006619 [Penstemon davidsonii]